MKFQTVLSFLFSALCLFVSTSFMEEVNAQQLRARLRRITQRLRLSRSPASNGRILARALSAASRGGFTFEIQQVQGLDNCDFRSIFYRVVVGTRTPFRNNVNNLRRRIINRVLRLGARRRVFVRNIRFVEPEILSDTTTVVALQFFVQYTDLYQDRVAGRSDCEE